MRLNSGVAQELAKSVTVPCIMGFQIDDTGPQHFPNSYKLDGQIVEISNI